MDQANEKDVGVSSSIKIRKPLLVKSKVFSLSCPYFLWPTLAQCISWILGRSIYGFLIFQSVYCRRKST